MMSVVITEISRCIVDRAKLGEIRDDYKCRGSYHENMSDIKGGMSE